METTDVAGATYTPLSAPEYQVPQIVSIKVSVAKEAVRDWAEWQAKVAHDIVTLGHRQGWHFTTLLTFDLMPEATEGKTQVTYSVRGKAIKLEVKAD